MCVAAVIKGEIMYLRFIRIVICLLFILFVLPPAAFSDYLLVASINTDQILKYDAPSGAFLGVFASANLHTPYGIGLGPDGNLYAATYSWQRILRYNGTTGAFMDTFVDESGGALENFPQFAFGPDNNLYVCDRVNHVIKRYNGTTGAFMGNFITAGAAPADLREPWDLVFRPDGYLYVCDRNNNRIQRYNASTGAHHSVFASGGGLDSPYSLAFGPDGHLYVASTNTDQVLRYDGTTGDFMGIFVDAGGPEGLASPRQIIFGPSGRLYVASGNSDQVLRYDGTTGAFVDVAASGGGLDLPHGMIYVAPPEINLKQGVTDIANGGSYNFGSQYVGTNTDITFSIENTGTGNLTLTTPITIGGADAGQFSVQQQPVSPVAPSVTTTFIIRFSPTSTGAKTASISIDNNDSDENPYDLTIQGTGTASEINLKQGVTDIADGGTYDFGNQYLGTNTDVTFTIENTGTGNLTLTTPITIGGADAGQFSVQQQPVFTVAPSGTTTFIIRFSPTSTGAKTASISIDNNDSDENPYDLTITGTGRNIPTVPAINEWGIIIFMTIIIFSAMKVIRNKALTF